VIAFFVHLPSGEITQTGYCPANQLQHQVHPGCVVREGSARLGVHYWEGQRLCELPPRPSDSHQFDYAAREWRLDVAAAWAAVRAKRDQLLAATDWRLLRAAETGVPVESAWLAYRQALRDVTQQDDPLAVDWPVAPG
jgi:hypothetical protein